jgi:parallel beta-helix repeat protein
MKSLVTRTLVLCVLALLAHPGVAAAEGSTLYVDQANPNCSDTGSGTAAAPFCKIGAAASRTTPGTTVLVSAGTYSEQVAPKSGAAGSAVTFAAEPGETVTVSGNGRGFYLSGRTWVTIERFNIANTANDGLYLSKSSFIKLIGNHVSGAGEPSSGKTARGITLSNVTDSLVSGNTVDHNSDYGIYLVSGSTRNEIVGNQLSLNARQYTRAASGIRLHSSSANTISSNVSHDNEDSGIELVTGSDNNLVVNNVSYRNGDHGIDNLDADGQRIVSNSVFGNDTAGINLEGGSTGGTLSNNISVDNGIGSPRTRGNIRVDSTSTTGTAIDYDLVWLNAAGVMIEWAGQAYATTEALDAATGQEANGDAEDPMWVAPSSGDLHLRSGSPAIDSANSGVSGASATDAEGLARVDDPGTANSGTGPRAYDDRGAHEFQGASDSPPVAALTVTPDNGTVELPVTADASASTDDHGIVSYSFDFDDGSPTVGPQPDATATHTYTTAGTFTVTVTVRDTAGQSSTASAQVRVNANLVQNPGFETGLTGWNTSGSGAGITLTRVSGGHTGDWAAKLTNTGTTASTCTLNDSPDWVRPTSTGTYTGRLWVRADTAGATLRLRFREWSGSTLVGTTTALATLTTTWQPVTVTHTTVSPGSSLDLNAYVTGAVPGTCFYADDASILLA